jgi:hypothetical protein
VQPIPNPYDAYEEEKDNWPQYDDINQQRKEAAARRKYHPSPRKVRYAKKDKGCISVVLDFLTKTIIVIFLAYAGYIYVSEQDTKNGYDTECKTWRCK